ncbi:protein max isoform X1 [Trichechus manatus latirostris]|uniref:Protein max n=2 Tax=Eutheria TaxID=9347 RepID=A0A2Y9QRT4_TRIMA|nr:protein max isoform X1 [Trichechus manatus latirostris]
MGCARDPIVRILGKGTVPRTCPVGLRSPIPVTRGSCGVKEEQPRFQSAADKRAHHNALERKRRDHIKDSFHSLRDSVPSLQGEKQQASRAQILDKATEYIQYMRRKNHTHQQDIDDLKRQNALLEQQVRALEKARSSAQLQTNYPSSDNSLYTNAKGGTISAFDGGSDSSSESEPEEPQSRKKLRMEAS